MNDERNVQIDCVRTNNVCRLESVLLLSIFISRLNFIARYDAKGEVVVELRTISNGLVSVSFQNPDAHAESHGCKAARKIHIRACAISDIQTKS